MIQVLAGLKNIFYVPLYRAGTGYFLRIFIRRDIFHNVRETLEKRVRGNREVSGGKSQLAYMPVGGHGVGWMLVRSHGKEVHPVLSGWGWPRQGHSQGSALIQMNFEAFDFVDVETIEN